MPKFVKAPNINDEYTLPELGGSTGQVLTMGSGVSTSWETPAIGTIDGSGSANNIPKFTDSDTVTTSSISDNGTVVDLSNGAINLGSSTTNLITAEGNTEFKSDTSSSDTLGIGSSVTPWKTITLNANSVAFKDGIDSDFVSMIPSTGNITVSGSFIKSGGTSSQFLKADGSVDSNTYAIGTIPTATSDLTNDSGFITSASLPTDFVSAASGGTFDGDILVDADLDVNGNIETGSDIYAAGKIGNLDTSLDKGFQFEVPSTTMQTMRTDSDAFRIYFGGTSGVGTAYEVSQGGEHKWDGSSGTTRMKLTTAGDLHVDGDVTAYSTSVSDISMKDNVKTIENATETVKELRGVSYDWNKGSRKGKSEIGLIAQEVEQVLPDLVHDKELLDGSQVKTIDYQKIIGLLIESNKELSNRLDKLEGCSCNKY